METRRPHVRTIPVRCAPSQAPCPYCGKLGRRKATHRRRVRTIAYKQVVFLDITYGEYRARCSCCTTFRTTPPGVEPRAQYDNTVRQAVLDRILDDGMSVERVLASMRRDFLLDLSDGFVYDCLDWQARRLDLADHRGWVPTGEDRRQLRARLADRHQLRLLFDDDPVLCRPDLQSTIGYSPARLGGSDGER